MPVAVLRIVFVRETLEANCHVCAAAFDAHPATRTLAPLARLASATARHFEDLLVCKLPEVAAGAACAPDKSNEDRVSAVVVSVVYFMVAGEV